MLRRKSPNASTWVSQTRSESALNASVVAGLLHERQGVKHKKSELACAQEKCLRNGDSRPTRLLRGRATPCALPVREALLAGETGAALEALRSSHCRWKRARKRAQALSGMRSMRRRTLNRRNPDSAAGGAPWGYGPEGAGPRRQRGQHCTSPVARPLACSVSGVDDILRACLALGLGRHRRPPRRRRVHQAGQTDDVVLCPFHACGTDCSGCRLLRHRCCFSR